MTKIGLFVWIRKVHGLRGDTPFTYRELPAELRSMSDLRRAVNVGYVSRIRESKRPQKYMIAEKAKRRLS